MAENMDEYNRKNAGCMMFVKRNEAVKDAYDDALERLREKRVIIDPTKDNWKIWPSKDALLVAINEIIDEQSYQPMPNKAIEEILLEHKIGKGGGGRRKPRRRKRTKRRRKSKRKSRRRKSRRRKK